MHDMSEPKLFQDSYSRRRVLKYGGGIMAASLVSPGLRAAAEASFSEHSVGATVETSTGKVRGIARGGIHAFKGIPYGTSAGGPNRFMPPRKPEPWTGVRDAFQFGHQAPQNMHFTDVLAPQADPAEGFDEDCLVLNVWTPGPRGGRGRHLRLIGARILTG
jgi:para-nitrobenzyl esterase